MWILSAITFIGGLGMFLFGMTMMSAALEKAAGEKLGNALESMTRSTFRGVLFGTAVTALIQSSSAMSVMVVGFVNAGIMSLKQAVPVILGANVGTTVTAQILRIGASGSENLVMQFFKPTNLAYIFIAVGAILIFIRKKAKNQDIGKIFIGIGILFIGMATMEGALSGFAESEKFRQFLLSFNNPIAGLLIGLVVTAAIQSSSASIGILQAMSTTGVITWNFAIPVILGQNIGACITSFLASIGAKKNAKSAAMVHIYFNTIGSLVFLAGMYALKYFSDFSFWSLPVGKGGIANFHTIFNIAAVILFLPFTGWLAKIAGKTAERHSPQTDELPALDERFYKTPAVALEQCKQAVVKMGEKAFENFKCAYNYSVGGEDTDTDKFAENEKFLDNAEVKIGQFMLGINQDFLPERLKRLYNEMYYAIREFERIGDYAEYILVEGRQMRERKIILSEKVKKMLNVICSATEEIIRLTVDAYKVGNVESAFKVEPLEQVIDLLQVQLEDGFMTKIQNGEYKFRTGIFVIEIMNDCAKIADHCSDIAVNIIEVMAHVPDFNRHKYLKDVHRFKIPGYAEQYNAYEAKYFNMIKQLAE